MADSTNIEWTDRTWNPWHGCSEIAPECGRHAPGGGHGLCYAAVFDSRGLHAAHVGTAVAGKWTGKITRSSPAVWNAPLKWPASLVFTCSMSDFWHEDVPLPWQDEALDVIDRTPKLTYQMLTKRPGNVQRRLDALKRRLPPNVWMGTTIGHAQSLPLLKPLVRIEASVRFISSEPLLTALPWLSLDGIGWLIAGGQSGRDAVPTYPDWVRHLRDLCIASGAPFHFKQWGEWKPIVPMNNVDSAEATEAIIRCEEKNCEIITREGTLWLDDGHEPPPTAWLMERVGKKAAGAMLDGREWREFPTINHGDAR